MSLSIEQARNRFRYLKDRYLDGIRMGLASDPKAALLDPARPENYAQDLEVLLEEILAP